MSLRPITHRRTAIISVAAVTLVCATSVWTQTHPLLCASAWIAAILMISNL